MCLHSETRNFLGMILVILSFFMMFLLDDFSAGAQNRPLKVSVVVIPPYSTRISDYVNTPNKINVTVINTSVGPTGKTCNFYLSGSMSCDAGVSIYTDPGYIPPRPVTILPGQVYRLTQADVQALYDANHIVYHGTSSQQILRDGGFPEGYYTICVSAYDYQTHARLSDDAPSGCASFPVSNLEAPYVQKPVCGDTIWAPQQLINFIWSPPAGTPGTTMYRLRIVELLSGNQLPPDAFKTTPPNPFFETTTPAPVFIYTSAYPPMFDGRTYAFAIQAFDTKGVAVFKNSGWSEICYFVYRKTRNGSGIVVDNGGKHQITNNFLAASVSGRIDYKFQGTTIEQPMKNIHLSLRVVYVVKNASRSYQDGQTEKSDEMVFDPVSQGFSTAKGILHDNMALRATTTTDNTGNFTFNLTLEPADTFGLVRQGFNTSYSITFPPTPVLLPSLQNIDPGVDPGFAWLENILGGSEGLTYDGLLNNGGPVGFNAGGLGSLSGSGMNYSNSFLGTAFKSYLKNELGENFESLLGGLANGKGSQTQVMSLSGHTQNLGTLSGDLCRYLRVVVDNDYFNSPDDDISLKPGDNLNLPAPLAGMVNTYTLNVNVKSSGASDQVAGPNSGLPYLQVEAGRINPIPEDVPFEEGQNMQRKQSMELVPESPLISTGETGMNPKGTIIFTNLVHNKGQHVDAYKLATSSGKRNGVYNYIPDIRTFDFEGKPGFNSQFTPTEYSENVVLAPDLPRIAGRVMYKNFPVQGAECSTNISQQKVYSDKDGYFEINNLPVVDETAYLTVTKYGYEDKLIENLGKFQKGGQYWNPDIELTPWGYITGTVEDQEGHPLEAEVQVDSLPFNETTAGYTIMGTSPQQFKFRAPSGSRKLHIVPVSPEYLDAVFNVSLNKTPDDQPPQGLGTFKVLKNIHRIRLYVWQTVFSGSMSPGKKEGVADCWADLDGFKKQVDHGGFIDFEVTSPATVFHVKIIPPDHSPWFIPVQGTISNQPSKNFITYSFELKQGKSVTGLVRSEPGMNPVKGARVFIAESSSDPDLSTVTDENGNYNLHGIPENLSKVMLNAAKYDSLVTYTGDSREVDMSQANPVANLTIKRIDDIDLTTIMGFPLELSDYNKQTDGTALVSGHILPGGNIDFMPADYAFRLDFTNLKIKKSAKLNPNGIPYAEPVDGLVKTDNHDMALRYHYGYHLMQLPSGLHSLEKSGKIQITKGGDGNGIIKGHAYILKNSFQFPSAMFDYDEAVSFFLYDPGSGSLDVESVAGKGSAIPASKFGLCSSTGKDLSLKFTGFSSTARSSGSYLTNDSLVLNLSITAKLKGSIPATVDVGKVQMTTSVISPIAINKPADIAVGKTWSVHMDKLDWNSGENGFTAKNASLKTGFAAIPVKTMVLKPDDILLDGFTINNLEMGNISPLDVNSDAQCLFYYDPNVGNKAEPHYVIKIVGQNAANKVASLKGLPGMQAAASLDIGSIQVLDDNEQLYSGVENSSELVFYDVFHLKVNQITSQPGAFTLTGIYNLNLPRIPAYNRANLNFYKDPKTSQLTLNFDPLPLQFTGPANVSFKASQMPYTDTIFQNYFQCKGKLAFTDQGATDSLDAILVRQPAAGFVMIYPETQSFVLGVGGTKPIRLDNLNGRMQANTFDWDFFWFKGTIANAGNAVQTSETSQFFVKGSISSEGNSISADNLTTPLGDVSLTYDMKNKVMHGSLILKGYPLCGFEAAGAADMEFGSNGWYLAASVNLVTPDPIIQKVTAGLAFGNISPVPKSLENTVLLNAENKLWPDAFSKALTGFFITGYKSIFPPFSINDGYDLGGYFVGYKLTANAGFDARFYMNFASGATEMGFGIMMYGSVSVYMGDYGGSICPYISGGAGIGFGINDGTYNFVSHALNLKGEDYVTSFLEAGVCFGPLCDGCISKNFRKTLDCTVTLTTQPKKIDFSASLK